MSYKRSLYGKVQHVKNSYYCKFKGKFCLHFATKEKAELALKYVNPNEYEDPTYVPIRAYLCKCGHWHLTSKPKITYFHKNYKRIPIFA